MSLYSFGDNNPNKKRSIAIGDNPQRIYVTPRFSRGFGDSGGSFWDLFPDWLFPAFKSSDPNIVPLERKTIPLTSFQQQAQKNMQKAQQPASYELTTFWQDFWSSVGTNWKQNLKDAAKTTGEVIGTGTGAAIESLGEGVGAGAGAASQFDWSKVIIWGSIAIGAVVLFQYVTRPRYYGPGY